MSIKGDIVQDENFNKGYVAGLIVGEGCFSGDALNPRLSIKQRENILPLKACQDLLGGRINGPYKYGIRAYDVWSLDGQALKSSIEIISKILPNSKKLEQFLKWQEKYML